MLSSMSRAMYAGGIADLYFGILDALFGVLQLRDNIAAGFHVGEKCNRTILVMPRLVNSATSVGSNIRCAG